MTLAIRIVNLVNVVLFAGLAGLALWQWRNRRDHRAGWAGASFLTLGAVVLLGRLLPAHPHLFVERAAVRVEIVILLLFPYCLYRFTAAFRRPSQGLTLLVSAMTVALMVWTIALPRIPQTGESRPTSFTIYIAAFVVHWAVLSIVVAARLWRAGRQQPSVARRRMELLAMAAAALTLALVLVAGTTDSHSPAALASGLLGTLSGVGFLLGLSPPQFLRLLWRRPEQQRMAEAVESLMQLATSQQEIVSRVLTPMAAIVGASGIVMRDHAGTVLAAHNVPEAALHELERGRKPARLNGESEVVELDFAGGSLLVWTTPYAPFFGEEELRLLRTLGALTDLALDRVRLFVQEREARIALERADELKTNFVALAAHELRTPVAAVQGLADTLDRRRDQLNAEQRLQLESSLAQQTTKLGELVTQLLDLSRLDAEAIPIEPEPMAVRSRVEELITLAAGDRAGSITVRIDPALEAVADPSAFDRVLTNLITNALRYGEPPVIIEAQRSAGVFRISVRDNGPGVAPEFVPDLFERFTRSDRTRERAPGTGLGLAIARSYARAQDGDLSYQPSEQGAHFQFELAQPA